jgi:hypothetical protein
MGCKPMIIGYSPYRFDSSFPNTGGGSMKRQILTAAMVLASGSAAGAQTIYRTIIDDGTEIMPFEMVLRVSRTTRDAMAAWMQPPTGDNRIHYNASSDGSTWRSTSEEVPRPRGEESYGGDPVIAFNYSGVGRVGYIGLNPCYQMVG